MRDLYAEKRKESIAEVTDEQREAIRVVAHLIADKYITEDATEEQKEIMRVDSEQALLKVCGSSVVALIGIHVRREDYQSGQIGFESCLGRLYSQKGREGEDRKIGELVPSCLAGLIGSLLHCHGCVDYDAQGIQRMFLEAALMKAMATLSDDDEDECDCEECARRCASEPGTPEA